MCFSTSIRSNFAWRTLLFPSSDPDQWNDKIQDVLQTLTVVHIQCKSTLWLRPLSWQWTTSVVMLPECWLVTTLAKNAVVQQIFCKFTFACFRMMPCSCVDALCLLVHKTLITIIGFERSKKTFLFWGEDHQKLKLYYEWTILECPHPGKVQGGVVQETCRCDILRLTVHNSRSC